MGCQQTNDSTIANREIGVPRKEAARESGAPGQSQERPSVPKRLTP
jgi:hypothetical protein